MMNIPDSETDAVLITGPTASGKSRLALEIARAHNGVVINADSMQVYDTLRVLTARPDAAEMDGVPHHLYGHVPAGGAYSTGTWLREAKNLVARLTAEQRLPVFVGGTGLYFRALTGGLSPMPEIPAAIRLQLRTRLAEEGADMLHAELLARDPDTACQLATTDGQRIVRALEVLEACGEPLSLLQRQTGPVVIDPMRARKWLVMPERVILHDRINLRFGAMLAGGAVEEVRALLALDLSPDLPAMKAIGVRQIAAMLRGELSPADAIKSGAAATRQYAKRQMTWFRNQLDESWKTVPSAGAG